MALAAGKLDRKVKLQRLDPAGKDGFGHPTPEAWVTVAEVSAGHSPVSDGERMRGGELAAEVSDRWTIRRSRTVATLDPRWRLVERLLGGAGERVHAIVGVKPSSKSPRAAIEISTLARAEIAS